MVGRQQTDAAQKVLEKESHKKRGCLGRWLLYRQRRIMFTWSRLFKALECFRIGVRVFPSLSPGLYWPEVSTGKAPRGILPPA